MFIERENDLVQSVLEFNSKPEYWRNILGANPIYFIHVKTGENSIFGLSKFCAFKDITCEEYLSDYRFRTNGNRTQKHISKVTNAIWQSDPSVLREFKKWITPFFPIINIEKIRFISIIIKSKVDFKTSQNISPEELKQKLDHQLIIGKIGEKIAYNFEYNRLKKFGIKNPSNYIILESLTNTSAGFDLITKYRKEERYIEVKATSINSNILFITNNEINTLRALGSYAWLYIVFVTNVEKEEGYVKKTINNPIPKFEENSLMQPIAYKVSFNDDDID